MTVLSANSIVGLSNGLKTGEEGSLGGVGLSVWGVSVFLDGHSVAISEGSGTSNSEKMLFSCCGDSVKGGAVKGLVVGCWVLLRERS